MIKAERFEGLVAAPFTPMDKSGNIKYDTIGPYYDLLEKNGVIGAFINGSTGEGPSLTQKEKQRQAEGWAERLKAGGKVRVINLVGGTSYRECIENAIFSSELGLSAIAILAPYYYKPSSPGQLAEFCARIGESVPGMPVYFYHIPVLTGVGMPMYGFIEKISGMLPNFAGIKYTQEDLMDFMKCLNYDGGRYEMLWGRDECLLPALAAGCRGAVGSTYNYAAPLYMKLIEAFNAGDLVEARRLQQMSVKMIDLLGKYGGMAVGKFFMKYASLDCGECRMPVTNPAAELYTEFVEDVRKLGMDDLFSKF
ncbi:MAG: dihydrodipicolinate synthase family protein [Bacteroidales bacterium]|nr:dihydrodipicolinate synthase family protein [Bacteroidales bacterium]